MQFYSTTLAWEVKVVNWLCILNSGVDKRAKNQLKLQKGVHIGCLTRFLDGLEHQSQMIVIVVPSLGQQTNQILQFSCYLVILGWKRQFEQLHEDIVLVIFIMFSLSRNANLSDQRSIMRTFIEQVLQHQEDVELPFLTQQFEFACVEHLVQTVRVGYQKRVLVVF